MLTEAGAESLFFERIRSGEICGWGGCENPPVCGRSCRPCFEDQFEQSQALMLGATTHAGAVRRAVIAELQRDRLARLSGQDKAYCATEGCGHMSMVHTDGGCEGIHRDGMDDWGCKCKGYTPREEVPRAD